MSLLTSLIGAGTAFQQTTGRQTEARDARPEATQSTPEPRRIDAGDDSVTIGGGEPSRRGPQLSVDQYKSSVGQDHAFVRDTLRHKLAEYDLNPATRLNVEKQDGGRLSLKALMPDQTRQQIEKDLNNNPSFREAFGRLSVNEPTLSFVDTAMKLNQAYGVSNPVLDQIVSENDQFNGLQDLAHRYDNVRRAVGSEQFEAAGSRSDYAFSLNA